MKRFFKTILVLAFLFIGLDFAYQKAAPEIEKTFGTRNPLPYLTAKVQQLFHLKKFKMTIKMTIMLKAILLNPIQQQSILISLIQLSSKQRLMALTFGIIQVPLILK